MLQEAHTTLLEEPVIERLPQTGPADKFNRELVRNVHPLDWANPKPSGQYNLVVIGDQYSRTRVTPFVKWLLGKWLAWTRKAPVSRSYSTTWSECTT